MMAERDIVERLWEMINDPWLDEDDRRTAEDALAEIVRIRENHADVVRRKREAARIHAERIAARRTPSSDPAPTEAQENVFSVWWSNAIENAALICRKAAQHHADATNAATDPRERLIHAHRANQSKELEDEIRALAKDRSYHTSRDPAPTEALRCLDCRLPYGDPAWADFVVSDADWLKICPEDNGVLCVTCMICRASVRDLQIEGAFTSGPFANRDWRKPSSPKPPVPEEPT